MLKELKRKSLLKVLALSVLLLCFSALSGFAALSLMAERNGAVSANELTKDNLAQYENRLIEAELLYTSGSYMEMTSNSKVTEAGYVIAIGQDDTFSYIGIKVGNRYIDEIDRRTYELNDEELMTLETIPLKGKLKTLSGKEKALFRDTFTSAGWTAEEIELYTSDYVIDTTAANASNVFVILFFMLLTVVLFALSICKLIKGILGGYMKKFKKDISTCQYGLEYVESDYQNAVSYGKSIKVGQYYLYVNCNKSTPRAFELEKIYWMYPYDYSTKLCYVIPVHTERKVKIWTIDNKKVFTTSSMAKSVRDRFMDDMILKLPRVIFGYDYKLEAMNNRKKEEFLDLKYNTVLEEKAANF